MLSNAYFLENFRFDTAENEPATNLQNFRKMHFSKMRRRRARERAARGGGGCATDAPGRPGAPPTDISTHRGKGFNKDFHIVLIDEDYLFLNEKKHETRF